MNLVVDASTLIAELLRRRGRQLFQRRDLRILVTDAPWAETERGLRERVVALRRRLTDEELDALVGAAFALVDSGAISIVPRAAYAEWEATARRRTRDQNDWQAIALALTVHGDILTGDPDFLGCGVATWTMETLLAELAATDGAS